MGAKTTKKTRQQYTLADKREWLAFAWANRHTDKSTGRIVPGVLKTAEHFGIDKGNLSRLIHSDEGRALLAEIAVIAEPAEKDVIACIIQTRDKVLIEMERRISTNPDGVDNRQLPIWFGILTDKAQLLGGKATDRFEGKVIYEVGFQDVGN